MSTKKERAIGSLRDLLERTGITADSLAGKRVGEVLDRFRREDALSVDHWWALQNLVEDLLTAASGVIVTDTTTASAKWELIRQAVNRGAEARQDATGNPPTIPDLERLWEARDTKQLVSGLIAHEGGEGQALHLAANLIESGAATPDQIRDLGRLAHATDDKL